MNDYVTLLLDLATEVEQFPLNECSLSDDLEKHWVYIAAFKTIAGAPPIRWGFSFNFPSPHPLGGVPM